MTGRTGGSLLALVFLTAGLTATVLVFVLPVVSFFDWRADDGRGVTTPEAVLYTVMAICGFGVRLGARFVIRHGYAMRGETPPDPLPVRPPRWGQTLVFHALVLAAIWFS